MNNNKVAFISYYSHQADLFESLKEKLNKLNNFQAFHLKSNQILCKGLIKNLVRARKKTENIEKIIYYSDLRFRFSRGVKGDDFFNGLHRKIISFAAKNLYSSFFNFFQARDVDLVVIWNGYRFQAASAVKAAESLDIKCLFLENGFFPETLVMDEEGVNAANSLQNKNKNFYKAIKVKEEKLKSFKESSLEQRQLRGVKGKISYRDELPLPDEFVFLPFQVLTDTQIIVNSPHIKSMEKLFVLTYRAVKKYNDKKGKDLYLVVKEHPSDFNKRDYSKLKEKYRNEKVKFLVKTPVEKIIDEAEAVITINSTVGIEALLKHKPVITLGEAFYNVQDLVYHVEEPGNLYSVLDRALNGGVNPDLIDRFIYFLKFHYLVEADRERKNEDDLQAIITRIKNVLTK